MNVSAVSTNAAGGSFSAGSTQEQQDQFLQLLITQIQNQNPLDPMSNEEFTAQLTQFSMLEQLEQVNDNLGQQMTMDQSLNNTMMLGLVGRTASVAGDEVDLSEGEATGMRLNAAGAGTATVTVTDESGQVVRTYVREVEAGWNDMAWDGLTDAGDTAADGTYDIDVSVSDRGGETVGHQLYRRGLVDSIRFENNLAILTVAGQEYYASEIAEVGR